MAQKEEDKMSKVMVDCVMELVTCSVALTFRLGIQISRHVPGGSRMYEPIL